MATTHGARRVNVPASRSTPRFAATVSSVTAAVLAVLHGAPSSADQSNVDEATLQEVVVTATRRAVSAQDLPIAITAVSGSSLDKAGIVDIAGLAHSMAGVNYTDKGPFGGVGGANLIIRGLNSETTSGLPAAACRWCRRRHLCRRYSAVGQPSITGSRPGGSAPRPAGHALRFRLPRRHHSIRAECSRSECVRRQGRGGFE